ncbi:uncharacterized protein LOC121380796 isoform X4 [Gigantopelta aegis]|uniref:uncharacterized protein LOC121380796 isoform X4 n=1 Tax=Gigantopelta aegis TaxID=1735272 RepID=UPI001B889367|nr:uncharacterized protein LOC121380796 isoform X4 [Gigantopelta aegis]
MDDTRPSRNQQLKLYEGWQEHKSTKDSKWKKLWCVLKGKVLYFFNTDSTEEKNHKGTLTISPDTTFSIKDGSPQKGWKYELYTGKRLNKFKTKMFSERELWRAYITGLCTGQIPSDLDLPPVEQREVESKLKRGLQSMQAPPVPLPVRPDSPVSNRSTGLESPHESGDGVFTEPLCDGGPTIRHKFWKDPSRTDKPSWFFEGITRTEAEKILSQCGFHGNTLMRESVTFRSTGSYVITKRMQHARVEFNHFEVTRVAEGFRINVENVHEHTPMLCLSEVMDFFVTMSGLQSTHPMTTNNPKDLAMDVPDYQTKIVRTAHDDESGEELEEDATEYEEPKEMPQITTPKTWSQPKMNRELGRNYGSSTMVQRGTRSVIQPGDFTNRVNAASAVNELDRTLDLYEDGQTYVPERTYSYENESVVEKLRNLSHAPPPPGPPPCTGKPAGERSYVNDPMAMRMQKTRSRSKSVPNIYPPGCNFSLAVPVSSELPAPGIVAPGQTPQQRSVDTPTSRPVSTLMSQFEQQMKNSPSSRNLPDTPQQRKVSFSLPGEEPTGAGPPLPSARVTQSEAAMSGNDRTSEMGIRAKPSETRKIKAELEGLFARGPRRPTSVLSPPVPVNIPESYDEEDYEDISNYVNID